MCLIFAMNGFWSDCGRLKKQNKTLYFETSIFWLYWIVVVTLLVTNVKLLNSVKFKDEILFITVIHVFLLNSE